MLIETFEVQNLGPLKGAVFPFVPGFNAIVGVNGSGKSTLLNAVALMLGRYSSAIRTGRVGGTVFDRDQIRRGMPFAKAIVTVRDEARSYERIEWSMGVTRPGRAVLEKMTNSTALIAYATNLAAELEQQPLIANIPLVVYYPAHRAVLDIPLRVRGTVPFEQLGALEGSLAQNGRSFREFFSWFRQREDLENEARLDGTIERDPELTAVRRAIASMLPGFENLKVRRSPLRMVITKNSAEFRVDQLSDGEKAILALTGDLARRLATTNPGLDNALHGSGVVLIDELELHLHPGWQRRTVEQLRRTFPNCQFIVSTHSPQILSEVAPEGIFLLKGGEVLSTDRSQGRSSNLILKELMEVDERPKWAVRDIDALYEALDDEDVERARALFAKLESELGDDDPGLTAARTILVGKSGRK
jgi:predicted ATP-binding protein involved in virulence